MYDDIFLFVKLVDIGSFSALSRSTGITQATLSRKMQNLEYRLGCTLFHKNTRKLEVNGVGKQLYNKFKQQETSLKILLDDIISTEDNLCGTLKIALPTSISKTLISPYLSNFTHKHPKVKLIISYVTGQVDLVRDGYDLALSVAMPRSQSSVVKLLHRFPIYFYATKKYFESHPPINNIKDFMTHKKLGFLAPDGNLVRQLTAKHTKTGEEQVIDIEPGLFINNMLHVSDIAKSNNILIAGWDTLVERQLLDGEIVKILPDYSFGELPCYLIKESTDVPLLHKSFISFIETCFSTIKF